MNLMSIRSRTALAITALCLASLAGCKNNEPLAREKLALENEWMPLWQKDCGKFYTDFDAFVAKNKSRIEDVEGRWRALSDGERDKLTKDIDGFGAVFKTRIEITIRCGKAPWLKEPDRSK